VLGQHVVEANDIKQAWLVLGLRGRTQGQVLFGIELQIRPAQTYKGLNVAGRLEPKQVSTAHLMNSRIQRCFCRTAAYRLGQVGVTIVELKPISRRGPETKRAQRTTGRSAKPGNRMIADGIHGEDATAQAYVCPILRPQLTYPCQASHQHY
jgi:hypothetical protein